MAIIRVIRDSSERPACQFCGVPAEVADLSSGIIFCADHCQKIMQLTTRLFTTWRWVSQVRFDEPEVVDPA